MFLFIYLPSKELSSKGLLEKMTFDMYCQSVNESNERVKNTKNHINFSILLPNVRWWVHFFSFCKKKIIR